MVNVRLPARLVLTVVLAAAADGVDAQSAGTASRPPASAASEPALSELEAQIAGAVTGLALGAALGSRTEDTVPELRPLRGVDAVLAGSAVALYAGSVILGRQRAKQAVPPMGGINGFDRKVRTVAVGNRSLENRRLLDHVSSGTLMVALFQPVGMLAAADVPNRWSRDLPVLAEATAVTLSVNAFVKHLTRRSRPRAHFCEDERMVVPCPPDVRVSFFSGHTSSAFVAAVAGGTLADFHHLPNRKWIWASGLTFASATGVLRIMSDQHYATDVLTGMVAGSLAGWLIPKLHEPDPVTPASAATPPPPPPATALPVVLRSGRSTALLTVGAAGGGPYVGFHVQW